MSLQPTIINNDKHITFLTIEESKNPLIVRALRNLGYCIFLKEKIKPSDAPSFLLNEYSKSKVIIIDEKRQEFKWPDPLFVPNWSLFDKSADEYNEKCRQWVRKTFYTAVPNTVLPRISSKYRCLFRCFSTLILAANPEMSTRVPRHKK